MSWDVAGPVHVDLNAPGQPKPAAAALVAAVMTALVLGGLVLAIGSFFDGTGEPVTISGQGSTEGLESLPAGQVGAVYLVLRNDSGHDLTIERVRPGQVRVRPGTARGACTAEALSVSTESVGLQVAANQTALLTASVRLDPDWARACRGAVFDLPVTALARTA